jgi:glyoxylase-like metal-dependent hydrolase (beta-lactamase superfamily II)
MGLAFRAFVVGPFETNAYLVRCTRTGEAAVMDVGFEPQRVLRAIHDDNLRVRHLLLTHAHYDHVAAMRDIQRELGVACWLHPEDRPLLEALERQGEPFGLPPAEPPEDLLWLDDGQQLPLGAEVLSVIHTPGHSPGSVTFRWGSILWVGDLLFARSVGRTDLPGGSFEALSHSVRSRLFPLGDDLRVLPGHGPETTLGAERRGNPFVGDAVGPS